MNGTTTDHHRSPGDHEIRLDGHLAPRWTASFDGLSVMTHSQGN